MSAGLLGGGQGIVKIFGSDGINDSLIGCNDGFAGHASDNRFRRSRSCHDQGDNCRQYYVGMKSSTHTTLHTQVAAPIEKKCRGIIRLV
jgi:hypothetical protein